MVLTVEDGQSAFTTYKSVENGCVVHSLIHNLNKLS